MKDQWQKNNINLNALNQQIKLFFTEKQFETKQKQTENNYTIEATTKKILGTQLKITVDITGQPNNFTIEYTTNKTTKGTFTPTMILGYITSPLGGGNLLLSEEKLKETLEKLEKMFWTHVDKQIAELTNSATKQPATHIN